MARGDDGDDGGLLKRPNICVVSLALLLLVHGAHLLESAPRCRDAARAAAGVLPHLGLALLGALALLALGLYAWLSRVVSATSPVAGVPLVPGAQPYLGHYAALLNLGRHDAVFRRHATPSGVSALWCPGLRPCATVLLARHARLVLRQSSRRDFNGWIARHGRRTLGEDSLILLSGGARWKAVRQVVARAFTQRIVRAGRRAVGECAKECADWLREACEGAGEAGAVCLEAESFFKLYALNVFGKVAMGHAFRCIPTRTAATPRDARGDTGRRDDEGDHVTSLEMPPEAQAFEFLSTDIGRRSSAKALLDPAMQLYWLPTAYNRTYRKNKALANRLVGTIVEAELDRRWARSRPGPGPAGAGGLDDSERSAAAEAHVDGGGLPDQPAPEGPSAENIITHLLHSCTEQHFAKTASASGGAPAKCPFAPMAPPGGERHPPSCSTASVSSGSTSSDASLPPSAPRRRIAPQDKRAIIDDVTKVLHTLLGAGYETTALSLSYVMYCLARHPRCQERCAEEARRVLGARRTAGGPAVPPAPPRDGRHREAAAAPEEEEDVIDDDLLPYCRAVLTEAIRLHVPVLFTTRMLARDLTLETGYAAAAAAGDDPAARPASCTLRRGMRVIINPEVIHRDERNFARAAEFVPERWVRWDAAGGRWRDRAPGGAAEEPPSSPSGAASSRASSEHAAAHAQAEAIPAADPANFLSFSDGARNCVGRRLAMMESTILIAMLLRDLCVGLGEGDEDFTLVKELRFVTVRPVSLPIVFWKRLGCVWRRA